MRSATSTPKLRRSHIKHQQLWASGELAWPDQAPEYNQFGHKLQSFSRKYPPESTFSMPTLKAEVFLRKLPIIDTPEMTVEIADLIESRQQSPTPSFKESQKYRKLSTVQAKYRFEQGDRKKALDLQAWLNAQMEVIESKSRGLPELMELKQQVVQIMLNEAIDWVQTICSEWADCLRTGLTTICALISKAFVVIHQKRTAEEKQNLEEALQTHQNYTVLIDKLKGQIKALAEEKEITDSFSNNLIYNMRIKTKQCRHLERDLKITTNRYKQLKEELQRFGLVIVESDHPKTKAQIALNETSRFYQEKSRANLKQSDKTIRSDLSIAQPMKITCSTAKNTLQKILVGDHQKEGNDETSHNVKEVKFNIPKSASRRQQVGSSNSISTRLQSKHECIHEQNEECTPLNKSSLVESLKADKSHKRIKTKKIVQFREDEPTSPRVQTVYTLSKSKAAITIKDIAEEDQSNIRKDEFAGSLKGLLDSQASRTSLNHFQAETAKSAVSLMRLKYEYLEKRKLLGENHFPIEVSSMDSINTSQEQVESESELQHTVAIREKKQMTDTEMQTDLTLVHANGFDVSGERPRQKTHLTRTRLYQADLWMNVATQTRPYCLFYSGIVSVKVIATKPPASNENKRDPQQRFFRQSILETIREASTKKNKPQSSEVSEPRSSGSVSSDRGAIDTGFTKIARSSQLLSKRVPRYRGSETGMIRLNSKEHIERSRLGSRGTLNRRSASKLEEMSKKTQSKHETPRKTAAPTSESSLNDSRIRSSTLHSPADESTKSKHNLSQKGGRRNANYNVLKPRIVRKNSLGESKVTPTNVGSKSNLTTKRPNKAPDMGADVIDVAINSFLRSDRSSGKEQLLPSDVLEKARETTKFLTISMQQQGESNQSGQAVSSEHLVKQVRGMYLHAYKQLVRGHNKLLLANIIISYFGILYGNLRNVSAKEKVNKFFKKVAECQHREPTLQTFCLLTGVGPYQDYQELLCVNDLPMYLKMFFTLNCASQDSAYTTLHKLKLHLQDILVEFVGIEMATELIEQIKEVINSKLAYSVKFKKDAAEKFDEQQIQINLDLTCMLILEKVFKARKAFQEDFQRVFMVFNESNTSPTVSVEFFEFLNRCISDSKIRYVSRVRTFLRECEMLHKNRKCMSREKFTMFAIKNNFPRFSQISNNLTKSMHRRTTLRHIRDFIDSGNCSEEWKKEKTYLWEELTRSEKFTRSEGIFIEFITNMIERATAEQAEFLQTLYEMIYYEVFDSQAQRLLVVTLGTDLTDLYVHSILQAKETV